MRYGKPACLQIMLLLLASGAVRAVDDCDPRLEQRVSIRSTGQPLGSFLGALAIETGVTAKADPSVAHHKLTVLTKDLPLSQLLSGVAEALHLQLKSTKSEDGAFTHQLYEDHDSKTKADQLYYLDKSALRRQADRAAEVLRLGLSEEELQKRIEGDAVLKPYIGEKSFRTAIEVYSTLSARDRARLWEIGLLQVALTAIPSDTRKKVTALFDENRRQRETADNVKLDESASSTMFETHDDPLAGRSLAFHIVGTGTHGITYMFMPSPEAGRDLLGNDEFFTLKEDAKTGEYSTEARNLPERLAGDANTELPEVTMTEALQRIHEASGISIIADHYTPRYSSKGYVDRWSITRGETIAHEIEKVAEVYQLKWKFAGDACIAWSKTWYEDRRVEIPTATIQHWQSVYQKNQGLDLPTLQEMALLNDRQQKTFRYYGISVPESFYPCMRALRFYSTLAPSEAEQASTGRGIEADKLADDQRQALIHWLTSPVGSERTPSRFSDADAKGAVIRVTPTDSGMAFRAMTSDGRIREDVLTLR